MAWSGKASIPVFPFSPPDGVVRETLYSCFPLFPTRWRGPGNPLFLFSPFPHQMAWSGKPSIPVFPFSPPDGVVWESLYSYNCNLSVCDEQLAQRDLSRSRNDSLGVTLRETRPFRCRLLSLQVWLRLRLVSYC